MNRNPISLKEHFFIRLFVCLSNYFIMWQAIRDGKQKGHAHNTKIMKRQIARRENKERHQYNRFFSMNESLNGCMKPVTILSIASFPYT